MIAVDNEEDDQEKIQHKNDDGKSWQNVQVELETWGGLGCCGVSKE